MIASLQVRILLNPRKATKGERDAAEVAMFGMSPATMRMLEDEVDDGGRVLPGPRWTESAVRL